MPFGLCNAPATFERLMEQVLLGLPVSVASVYLDVILIIGQSLPQHHNNLRQVFDRVRRAGLKMSPEKKDEILGSCGEQGGSVSRS